MLLVILLGLAVAAPATAGAQPRLPVAGAAWPLPTAFGKITSFDHSYADPDPASGRLYVSLKGEGNVVVLGLAGQLLAAIPVHAPQGLGVANGRLFVGSDEIGLLNVFDIATNYTSLPPFNFSLAPDTGEADDIVVAPNGDILVSVGDDGADSQDPAAIAVVDSAALKVKSLTPTGGAHVEGFALLAGSSTSVMASTPDLKAVLQLDLATQATIKSFKVPAPYSSGTPLALDAANERVLLGSREPPALVVMDVSAAGNGKLVYSHPIVSGCDDLHFDAESGMVYASGGGNKTSPGAISVFFLAGDSYSYLGSVGPAGKNSEYSAARKLLWSTVPAAGTVPAFVQLFAV